MLSDFKDLFNAYCTEGLVDTYLQLDDVVEDFDLVDLTDELTQIRQSLNLYDELTVGDMIFSKIYERLSEMLSDHNIFLVEEATISEIVTVAENLRLIKKWDDKASIISILDQDDISEEEKFAELCALVSTVPAETYLAIIDSIGDGILDKIRELYVSDIVQDGEEVENIDAYVAALKALYVFFSTSIGIDPEKMRTFQIIKSGLRPGASFKFYFDLINHHFKEGDETNAQATDLLVMMMISEDCHTDINSAWQKHAEYVYSSLDTIQATGLKIRNLHTQYMAWHAQHHSMPSVAIHT